jgi:YesN/AraC family two-component response regulator
MVGILVVEDDEDLRELLVEVLQENMYWAIGAASGPEALLKARQTTLDLVITDIRLPGMDGVELLGKIKKIQPRVKSIVITGYASEDTPVRAIRCQVSDYLFKPFSLQYFLDSVNRTIHEESEKTSKRELFGWLFQKLGLSLASSQDRALERVVEERQEAFRFLFVGTRSTYLSQHTACELYTKLELLETRFRSLLNEGSPKASMIQEIQTAYRDIQMYDTSPLPLNDINSERAEKTSSPSIIDQEQFKPLYEAIKQSEISFEELLYSPLLRITPDARFETMKELVDLKRKLWSPT